MDNSSPSGRQMYQLNSNSRLINRQARRIPAQPNASSDSGSIDISHQQKRQSGNQSLSSHLKNRLREKEFNSQNKIINDLIVQGI
jgi:hypothetical protein